MRWQSKQELQRRRDRQGWVLIGACVGLVGVGVGTALSMREPARDGATGCRKGSKASRQVLLVLDRSDALQTGEDSVLGRALASTVGSITREERLTILGFSGRGEPEPALFDRCRPREGRDVSWLWATPAHADREYRVGFAEPAARAVEWLAQRSAPSSETHLVAFLGRIAANARYAGTAERLEIHVFGDMAENTPAGTFVAARRKPFESASFTSYVRAVSQDRLAGISLHVHVVPTPATAQAATVKRIREAWSAALTSIGVTFSWKGI